MINFHFVKSSLDEGLLSNSDVFYLAGNHFGSDFFSTIFKIAFMD